MEIVFNMILIATIVVFILDISGFADTIRRFFTALGKRTPKVMVCSLCLTWWLSLIYLIITNALKLHFVVFALIIANLTPIIKGLWDLAFDALNAVIIKLSKIINK